MRTIEQLGAVQRAVLTYYSTHRNARPKDYAAANDIVEPYNVYRATYTLRDRGLVEKTPKGTYHVTSLGLKALAHIKDSNGA